MKIILDQCDKETKTEITINSSYKDNMNTGDVIEFPMQIRKICNDGKDKNVFFGSQLSSITEHQF